MWIICGELRSLYEDRLADPDRLLMSETLDSVRDLLVQDSSDDRFPERAAELAASWAELIAARGDEILPGQWNAWITFEDLAREVSGSARPGVREYPTCWVVTYNSKLFIDTGSIRDALAGTAR